MQGTPQPPNYPPQGQPQQPAPQQGAYPSAQAYRQYLQTQTPGAHMSYNQYVESQGGPSPGMQQTVTQPQQPQQAGGPGGPPAGGQAQWNAYRALQAPTGKGWGAAGNAATAYAQQYGNSYDPEGILAKVQALRAANPQGKRR